jgi:hypothetical protein
MTEAAPTCPRCGASHEIMACPYVKGVEFELGVIRRIWFLTPADYLKTTTTVSSGEESEPDYPKLKPMKGFST